MKSVQELEKEFAVATELAEKLEALKKRQPEYFESRKKIFEAYDQLEQAFLKHLEEDKKFLEDLPQKIEDYKDRAKEVLELRKQIMEMLKLE